MNENVVGIRRIGTYFPQGIRDSKWIAEASGIPEKVIREKFGIKQVYKAGPEESVSEMGIKAAIKALGDFDPKEIDLVVYCGSEYKDYYLFNCAAKIQQGIGATNAATFEMHSLCSAGVYSLKVLKSMMLADDEINNVLLVSSSKEGDLINYQDNNSRFMFNFGDGAAAVHLQKGLNENIILETTMISDGRFADDISVPGVGCKNFSNFMEMNAEDHYLRVMDIDNMKERLDPITMNHFISVIEKATKKSGFENSDISFIAPIFMKRSISKYLLQHFNLKEENTFLLEEYGHCQSADAFISIEEGIRHGRIKDGDLVLTVAAGTGYTWASTAIRWGKEAILKTYA